MFVVAIAVVCSVCIGEPVFAGSLVAWGNNDDGQGNAPDGNDFVAIAAGGEHSLALKLDGSLAAWGNNDYGQLDVPEGNDFAAIAGREVRRLNRRLGRHQFWSD